MKKIIGLIAMLLLASGLVTVAAPAPSQAACPYTNCLETRVVIAGATKVFEDRRTPYTYNIRVRSNRGDGRPNGALYVTFRGAGIEVSRFFPSYGGGVATVRVRFPNSGNVRVRAVFSGDGAWKNSAGSKFIKVRRR